MSADTIWDAVVVGGGAVGLMCAWTAAARGKKVLLLEHNSSVGEKIRISGGGRCNFTNTGAVPARYVSENPRFCYSALARYAPKDFIALVAKHGIAYHEKKLGQLFCDGTSMQIIEMLMAELRGAGGTVWTECRVESVERAGEGFKLATSRGEVHAWALVVACGGLSIPALGVTALAYEIAKQFEVPVIPTRPALVPLVWSADDAAKWSDLSGVSFDCIARAEGPAFREHALFTHRGLSGPAILQASSYWREGQLLHLDLDPDKKLLGALTEAKQQGKKAELRTVLSAFFTQRFAQRLCEVHGWQGTINTVKDALLREIAQTLQHWDVRPAGTEGYKKAEVTAGGIDTRALDPKTLQAKAVPGLYFIGECVDVTGWLGGYNFQWAWASGHACGEALSGEA